MHKTYRLLLLYWLCKCNTGTLDLCGPVEPKTMAHITKWTLAHSRTKPRENERRKKLLASKRNKRLLIFFLFQFQIGKYLFWMLAFLFYVRFPFRHSLNFHCNGHLNEDFVKQRENAKMGSYPLYKLKILSSFYF